jgi:FtsP/CotA-like multicopper oxidase with cupredoxin domain
MRMRALLIASLSSLPSYGCGDDDDANDTTPDHLDPASLDKFVAPVRRPERIAAFGEDGSAADLVMGMFEITQQLHPQLPPTRVWAYGRSAAEATYPGPTIDARPGIEARIRWENHLPAQHFLPVDTTIHWAAPEVFPGAGVPTVVHVHGGLQESASDGHPDAWFTPDFAQTGPAFVHQVYRYANKNLEETLWYHDHALGITRLNVYAGLAGFYLLRDPGRDAELAVPSGEHELELLLQDRSFRKDGSLFYPDTGDNPDVHPNWVPEFFGDMNLVNGVVWPFLEVEPRRYRFRLLNGANARFYNLSFSDGRSFIQIGSDGGYLAAPVEVRELRLAPGERADVIVDFTGLEPGASIELRNDAPAPYPGGDSVDEHTSRVMQFRAIAPTSPDESVVPATLDVLPTLGPADRTRTLTLIEVEDEATGDPLGVFLDGKHWGGPGSVTELPEVGSTEIWELVNLTDDAHPIHLHLVDLRILNRQPFDADRYRTDYEAANPNIESQSATKTLDVAPYLQQGEQPPAANEAGWKDTIVAPPDMVTRFIVRWTPDAGGPFPFDVTAAPGYVWHCHILEHEDNEMMRRLQLVNAEPDVVTAGANGSSPR